MHLDSPSGRNLDSQLHRRQGPQIRTETKPAMRIWEVWGRWNKARQTSQLWRTEFQRIDERSAENLFLLPHLLRKQGFPSGSDGKESACNAGYPSSIPGSGRSPGDGHGYPLQYSCLENPMDRGAWWATVLRSAQSQTQLKRLSIHSLGKHHSGRIHHQEESSPSPGLGSCCFSCP